LRNASPRERLIEAGLKLFYRDGFHATGIDTVLAEARVAKKTLYTHFKSKEDLILAVMRRRDELYRNWFMREVEKRSTSSEERLLACFDVIDGWVKSKDFYGCACINASAEFADKDDPIHRAAAEHKQFMMSYLEGLARAAQLENPGLLARQLLVMVDGAVVVAQVTGRSGAVADAKRAAQVLISWAAKHLAANRKPAPALA
jgi:AcrR family transcriptional regulator